MSTKNQDTVVRSYARVVCPSVPVSSPHDARVVSPVSSSLEAGGSVSAVSVYVANAGLGEWPEEGREKLLRRVFGRYGSVSHVDLLKYPDVRSGSEIYQAFVHMFEWNRDAETLSLLTGMEVGKTRVDYVDGKRDRYFICQRNRTHKKTDEEKAALAAAAASVASSASVVEKVDISLTDRCVVAGGLFTDADMLSELSQLADAEESRQETEVLNDYLDHERYTALTTIAYAEEVIRANCAYLWSLRALDLEHAALDAMDV